MIKKEKKEANWADALREIISIICKCRSSPPPCQKGNKLPLPWAVDRNILWQLMMSKSSMHCLLLIANPCLPGKLTKGSWYFIIIFAISFWSFSHQIWSDTLEKIIWLCSGPYYPRRIARVQTLHFNMFLLDIHWFKLRKRSKTKII